MSKMILRANAHQIYRGLWFVTGLFGMFLPFHVYVQHRSLEVQTDLAGIGLILLLDISIIVGYFRGYLSIESSMFVLNKMFSVVKVNISQIDALNYERRLPYFYLIVKYHREGRNDELAIIVDSMSTEALQKLNAEIRRQNPSVEISIDAHSQKYQQHHTEAQIKIPTGGLEWTIFSLKWLVIGAVSMFILLWFTAPR
jgi:hypothetical protein